jgi:hypothetical protein
VPDLQGFNYISGVHHNRNTLQHQEYHQPNHQFSIRIHFRMMKYDISIVLTNQKNITALSGHAISLQSLRLRFPYTFVEFHQFATMRWSCGNASRDALRLASSGR